MISLRKEDSAFTVGQQITSSIYLSTLSTYECSWNMGFQWNAKCLNNLWMTGFKVFEKKMLQRTGENFPEIFLAYLKKKRTKS
jgi:hypothetical protein